MLLERISEFLKKKVRNHPFLFRWMKLFYTVFFYWDTRQKRRSFGDKNPEVTFYVIPIRGEIIGIMGIYLYALRHVIRARKKGYVPIVDMKNYPNRYASLCRGGAVTDPWLLFFAPLSPYSLEEVYQSKNVVLAGWTFSDLLHPEVEYNSVNSMDQMIRHHTGEGVFVGISAFLRETAQKELEPYLTKKTLGVLVRGTDYVSIRPMGHFAQPSVEELTEQIEAFVKKYDLDNVFLVTEDIRIEEEIRKRVSVRVSAISQPEYASYDYQKGGYLFEYIQQEDLYASTMKYAVKCVGLSQCDYLVSAVASGSMFSTLLRLGEGRRFADAYFFDERKY